MTPLTPALLTFLMVTSQVTGQGCVPGATCRLPDCRCWDDPELPGHLAPKDVPQMVLLSFQYAINRSNVGMYTDLLKNVTNPNSCNANATFFVQALETDFAVVKQLFDAGYEIGMTSVDGVIPKDDPAWMESYQNMKKQITRAFIPASSVQGSRGPELSSGGDAQLGAMLLEGLSYDSTCSSSVYAYQENLLWPYTYDFSEDLPECATGNMPKANYPGKWQFMVPSVRAPGQTQSCAILSDCSPFLNSSSSSAAFNLIFDSFSAHYNGTRSPFVLYLDPLWLTDKRQMEGTRRFIDLIAKSFKDTWFISHTQALQWIREPVPLDRTKNFLPWTC